MRHRSIRVLAGALSLVSVLSACGRETANRPPVARAGDDRMVFRGATVSIDGSIESTDADGDELAFTWTQLAGPPVSVPTDAAILTFPANVVGSVVFRLTVDDGSATSSDVISVIVQNDLQVTSIVPVETADVTGAQPLAVFFNAPIRPWTAPGSVIVEDVTDPLLPIPVLGNVTLEDGGTAVLFTPATAWTDAVPYLLTVTTAPMGLDGAPLRIPVERNVFGAAVDITAPTVLSATPSGPGAPISTSIELIFSEPVSAATLGAIGLADAALAPRDGTVSLTAGGMRVVFTPADTAPDPDDPVTLAPSTDYVLTVLDSLTDLTGTPLDGDSSGLAGGNYVLSFQTAAGADTTPPRIANVSPIFGAQGISVKLPTVITFDEPIEPSTLAGAFIVGSSGLPAAGTVTTLLGNTVAVFTPASNLATGARYDISLAGTVADLSGNMLGSPFSSFYRTGASPPPTVTTILPDFSPKDQTVSVEIQGADFVNGAQLFVLGGGVIVGNTTVVASDAIQADLTLSPFAAVGARSISVTNPDGQSGTGFGIFQILEKTPEISSINPASAGQGDANRVVSIFGEGFLPGASVTFTPSTGITFDSITVVSPTQITIQVDITGGAPLGLRDVTVTNTDLQFVTESAGFRIQGAPPTVTTCTPNQGAQGTVVSGLVINGTNFLAVPPPTVSFGAGTAVDVLTVTPTSITVDLTVFNTAALGLRNVTVTNDDGQMGTGTNVFNVLAPAPTVTMLTPAVGNRGQTNLMITVTGTGFITGATVAFSPNGAPAITFDSAVVMSPTQLDIQIDIPAGAALGLRDFTVTNPNLLSGTKTGAFTVRLPAPTVTNSVPNSGAQGVSINGVVVNGTNIQVAPLPTVSFGAGIAVNVTGATATTATVNLTISDTATLGSRDVTVTNTDGQSATAVGAFAVTRPPPTVTGAAPLATTFVAKQSGVVELFVTGTGFDCLGTPAGPTFEVRRLGIASVDVTENNVGFPVSCSSTSFSRNVSVGPTAAVAFHDIRVTNPDGQQNTLPGTGTGVLEIRAESPTFTSALPNPKQGETRDVTVSGNFFQSGASVTTAAGTVNSVTFVSATSLTVNVTIPFGTAAATSYAVNVTNPDGQSVVAANGLTVDQAPGPTVTSCTPSTGAQGQTLDVTVNGQDFQPLGTAVFSSSGVVVNSRTFVSPTTLTLNVTIGAGALGGRTVTITNTSSMPNQMTTSGTVFTVTALAPTVTSVAPSTGAQNTFNVMLTVNGTNFVNGAGLAATFSGSGINVDSTAFVSATQLNVQIDVSPSAPTGFRNVTVTNPDGGNGTLSAGFQVTGSGLGPTVSAIERHPTLSGAPALARRLDSANSLRFGRTARFHILGANFPASPVVSISGAGVSVANVVRVNAGRIDADISLNLACTDIAPGPRDVTVLDPSTGQSNTLVDGFLARHGVVINEVATSPRTKRIFQTNNNFVNQEVLEVYNGSGCAFNVTNWRLDFVDTRLTGYEFGALNDSREIFSGGSSLAVLATNGYFLIVGPDYWNDNCDAGPACTGNNNDHLNNSNNLADNVFLALFTLSGRYIDDVEIGDNEENDSATDGAPAAPNNGANTAASDEMVARCPDGSDTDNDIDDFFQDEVGGSAQAATNATSNNTECPPCADGGDNDLDGWVDMLDPGCSSPTDSVEGTPEDTTDCSNGADSLAPGDTDSLVDENDPDCFSGKDTSEVD